MHTPLDIYKHHNINRGLQNHQLRVAAVGKYIADRMHTRIDARLIVQVGLFHDMGNIIKSDFSLTALYEPEGVAYWQKVKEEFIARYSTDEHVATNAIVREIGLPEEVIATIEMMRFSQTPWILEKGSLEHKICKYADLRVAPFGVVSLSERLAELRVRYAGRRSYDTGDDASEGELARSEEICMKIEEAVCAVSHITPAEITDASIAPSVEELKKYPVA